MNIRFQLEDVAAPKASETCTSLVILPRFHERFGACPSIRRATTRRVRPGKTVLGLSLGQPVAVGTGSIIPDNKERGPIEGANGRRLGHGRRLLRVGERPAAQGGAKVMR